MNTITRIITETHEKLRSCDAGSPADYIPELARVDPDLFGITLTTSDGHSHRAGDADVGFTIQSVSKAFVYGLVLDALGPEATEERVNLEPSGDAFNEISLEPVTSKPMNAMINAGAIAITGLVPGTGSEDRFAWIRKGLSAFAGRDLELDEAVYRSESETGHRNRAIAHLLRSGGILGDHVDEDLDLYFRQCSLLVTCADLAIMGATLVRGGINPITGERVISDASVERVLSVMCSSGMYNWSGTWITKVGLPAKSGVGGGVVAVLPGQLSMAVFSPRLDAQGNSVRGVRALGELSQRFNLHLFNTPTLADQVVRRSYRLSDSGSTRMWPTGARHYLQRAGRSVVVIEVQGDLFFAAIERLSRSIEREAHGRSFILDCSRVGFVDPACRRLLRAIASDLDRAKRQLIVVDPNDKFRSGDASDETTLQCVRSLDLALEGSEIALLRAAGLHGVAGSVDLAECELFNHFSAEDLDYVRSLMSVRTFAAGAALCRTGDRGDCLFVLTDGGLDILAPSGASNPVPDRIASVGPGVCVGEIALIERSARSADIVATEHSTCSVLSAAALDRIENDRPVIYGQLMRNVMLMNFDRLRRSGGTYADRRD